MDADHIKGKCLLKAYLCLIFHVVKNFSLLPHPLCADRTRFLEPFPAAVLCDLNSC